MRFLVLSTPWFPASLPFSVRMDTFSHGKHTEAGVSLTVRSDHSKLLNMDLLN